MDGCAKNDILTIGDNLFSDEIDKLIKLIDDAEEQSIIILTGAGISTSAGIPDFRSPKDGQYMKPSKYGFSRPEYLFYVIPFAFDERPFYDSLSVFKHICNPTLTHEFIRRLCATGKVRGVVTQNVDGLERKAKIPEELLVYAHGVLDGAICVGTSDTCTCSIPDRACWDATNDGAVSHCPDCGSAVKPKVILYGDAMPEEFELMIEEIRGCSLMIVMGTELKTEPLDGTIAMTMNAKHVLINRTPVNIKVPTHLSEMGIPSSYTPKWDIQIFGSCDKVSEEISKKLWSEGKETASLVSGEKEESDVSVEKEKKEEEKETEEHNMLVLVEERCPLIPPTCVEIKGKDSEKEYSGALFVLTPKQLAEISKEYGVKERGKVTVTIDSFGSKDEKDRAVDVLVSFGLGGSVSFGTGFALTFNEVDRIKFGEKPLRDSWMAEKVYKPYKGHWGSYANAVLMAEAEPAKESKGFVDFWSIVKRCSANIFCHSMSNILELLADYMELPIDNPWEILERHSGADLTLFPKHFKESVDELVHKATKYHKFATRVLALCSCVPSGPLPMDLCRMLVSGDGDGNRAICRFVVSRH